MNALSLYFSTAFTLFLLMDSLGNIPLFIALLKGFTPQKQRKIIIRELLISLTVMVLFYFLGDFLLNLMHVKQHTVLVAGGLILFIISIQMVFSDLSKEDAKSVSSRKEPFIVPLAIPLLAGPAVLASMMLYAKELDHPPLIVLAALLSAWALSGLILLTSSFLQKLLGEKGVSACQKLMGLLLTLISVQMFLEGVSLFLLSCK